MLLVQHQPDTATMSVQCDALGRCAVHPFVQIRRKSTRTGQWKELLESCPLCAMDGRSSASVSGGSSVCSASSRGAASTGGMADRSDRSGYGSSSSEENDGLDGSRRSRVSFHGEAEDEADDIRDSVAGGLSSLRRSLGGGVKDTSGSLSGLAGLPDAGGRGGGGVVDLSSRSDDRGGGGGGCGGSVVSSGARSALKRPKYKVCKDLMRQQLDDSNRVPKMSEDLDIDVESDDEDGPDKDALVPTPRVDDDSRDGREEEGEREEMEEEEEPADLPETRRTGSNGGQAKASSFHGHGSGRERRPPPRQSASFHADTAGGDLEPQGRHQQQRPASFHGNPEDDRAAPRQQPRQQQPQRRTDGGSGRASGGSSQSSSQSSSSRQAKSTSQRSSRSKRETKGQQRSASCHAGIRTPASIEPEGTRPDPEEFPCGQSRSSRDSGQRSRGSQPRGIQQLAVVSPSGAVTPRTADAVQSARPAPSSATPGVAPPPPRPEYNMIIRAPKNFKDDVSTLSFMGSVSTPPPPPAAQGGGQRMSNIGEEEDECEGEHGDDDGDDDADRIDTNEFDKKGRCVRHKHVRLRKKVRFHSREEGWKT